MYVDMYSGKLSTVVFRFFHNFIVIISGINRCAHIPSLISSQLFPELLSFSQFWHFFFFWKFLSHFCSDYFSKFYSYTNFLFLVNVQFLCPRWMPTHFLSIRFCWDLYVLFASLCHFDILVVNLLQVQYGCLDLWFNLNVVWSCSNLIYKCIVECKFKCCRFAT